MAFILLTLLYVLIDVTRLWNGAPFRYVGKLIWNERYGIYFCSSIAYNKISFDISDNTSVSRLEFYSDLHGTFRVPVLLPIQMGWH